MALLAAPVALPTGAPLPEAFDALAAAEEVLEATLAEEEEEALRRELNEGSWTGGLAALQIFWAAVSVEAWSAWEQLA